MDPQTTWEQLLCAYAGGDCVGAESADVSRGCVGNSRRSLPRSDLCSNDIGQSLD